MKKKEKLTPWLLINIILIISIFISLSIAIDPYIEKYLLENSANYQSKQTDNVNNDEVVEDNEIYSPLPVEQEFEDPLSGYIKGVTYTQPKGSVKIPVLMYHNIGPVPTSGSYNYKGLYVSPSMFDAQMKFLKDNGYKTLTPQQFLDILKTGKNPKQKSVLITFDDGTKGQYTYAYPVLKKYKQTATFYIVSDKLQISANQLKKMSKDGMIIDSHSSTHKDLRVLNNKKQLKYEITSSKYKLQNITGQNIVSIAYPGCVADKESFEVVGSTGYKLGFSCGRTIYHYYKNRFYLSRIHVYSNMTSFKKALTVGLY